MRIAILTADYPPAVWSGIGTAVHRQAADLSRLGETVTVITPCATAASPEDDHVRVVGLAAGLSLPACDVVHVHSLSLTEIAVDLRRSWGAALVATVHTQPWIEVPDARDRRFWLDTQARLLSSSDAAVFLSERERATAEAIFPSLPAVHVVPNGVARCAARSEAPGDVREPVALFVGRATRAKGIDVFADCVRLLRASTSLRFEALTGHGDRRGGEEMSRLAREERCAVVNWLPRADVDTRLARARLVLMPSRYEPFGLVALEAMRLGTPVLAADVGGLRDIVRADAGGMRITSHDPRRWAAETKRIMEDAALWNALHERGPRFVRSNYDSVAAAQRLRDVYGSALNAPVHRIPRGWSAPV